MSERIILDADGLTVSLPGHDASTASPMDLAFSSSRYSAGVLQTGTVVSNFQRPYPDAPYFDRITVAFPPLPFVPLAMAQKVVSANEALGGYHDEYWTYPIWNNGHPLFVHGGNGVRVSCGTGAIELGVSSPGVYRYVIFNAPVAS